MKQFKRVAEAVTDSRHRLSLGRAGVHENARYAIAVSDDGDILLTPMNGAPESDRWTVGEFEASLARGIADVEAGRVVRRSFLQYADDGA